MRRFFSFPTTISGRILWLMQAVCLLSALAVIARPTYRMGKRHWLYWRAASSWQDRDRSSAPEPGNALAWLSCKSIRLDSPVLYDATPENLNKHPSLARQGCLPHEKGMLLVQGHRDTHFRNVGSLVEGDLVVLETVAGEKRSFRAAEAEVVSAENLSARLAGARGFRGLVLITCYPFTYIGPAPDRYLVWLPDL